MYALRLIASSEDDLDWYPESIPFLGNRFDEARILRVFSESVSHLLHRDIDALLEIHHRPAIPHPVL